VIDEFVGDPQAHFSQWILHAYSMRGVVLEKQKSRAMVDIKVEKDCPWISAPDHKPGQENQNRFAVDYDEGCLRHK
jgi:hypothetical protein